MWGCSRGGCSSGSRIPTASIPSVRSSVMFVVVRKRRSATDTDAGFPKNKEISTVNKHKESHNEK